MWKWLKKTLKVTGTVAQVAAPIVVEVAVKNPRNKMIAEGAVEIAAQIREELEKAEGQNTDKDPSY
jgi:hypothetical protein